MHQPSVCDYRKLKKYVREAKAATVILFKSASVKQMAALNIIFDEKSYYFLRKKIYSVLLENINVLKKCFRF